MPFPYGLTPDGRVSVDVGGVLHTAEYRAMKGGPVGRGGRVLREPAVLVWSAEIGPHDVPLCDCRRWPCVCTAEGRAEHVLRTWLFAALPRPPMMGRYW